MKTTETEQPFAFGTRNPAVLTQAIAQLEKQYGLGAVMRLGESNIRPVDTFSTGCFGMDIATGCGGYPRGRVIEIYGPESSGKTTLTLHAIAACQARDGIAAFVDAEHALDPAYAKALGVDLDGLLIAQPDDGEQALDIAEQLVTSGGVDLVVVDSVAALVPRAELAGDMGDMPMGLQARLMSQALRKLTGAAAKHKTTIIFINQLRQKIGVVFGSNEVTTGGNALKFYASLRLDVRRIGGLKDGLIAVGNRTRVKVVKNKLAPPFRQVEVEIRFGHGICPALDLLDRATEHGVIDRTGSWYSFGDTRLGQGRENVRTHFLNHPELMTEVRHKVLAFLETTHNKAAKA